MDIKGKFKALVVKLANSYNQANDGNTANLDLEVGLTRGEVADRFGSDFAGLCFCSTQVNQTDSGDEIVHMVDTFKPGRKVVCQKHAIRLGDVTVSAQPQVLKVSTVQGKELVDLTIRVPVDADGELGSGLWSAVGETIDVEFSPQQQQLELVERKAE
jgi:hypothetical protein